MSGALTRHDENGRRTVPANSSFAAIFDEQGCSSAQVFSQEENPMLLFEDPAYIKVSYAPDNELLMHEWRKYPTDDTKAMALLRKLYEIFLEYKSVQKIIVKTDEATGVFSQEVQNYIDETQFPNIVANTDLRYVVTVVPQSALSKLATGQWQKALQKGERMVIHNVATEDEARAWLQQFN